jgi:hypothetical protein
MDQKPASKAALSAAGVFAPNNPILGSFPALLCLRAEQREPHPTTRLMDGTLRITANSAVAKALCSLSSLTRRSQRQRALRFNLRSSRSLLAAARTSCSGVIPRRIHLEASISRCRIRGVTHPAPDFLPPGKRAISPALLALRISCNHRCRPSISAARTRALPSAVRAPVLIPPCNLQRVLPGTGHRRQAASFPWSFAPQRSLSRLPDLGRPRN